LKKIQTWQWRPTTVDGGWRQVVVASREALEAFGYKIKRIIDVAGFE